jgi:ATP-binding cassette, subfamily B, bacterial PglK
MFFSGLLELFGISLIIPILSRFIEKRFYESDSFFDQILIFFDYFYTSSLDKIIFILIIFFIFKNIFSIISIYANYRFSFSILSKVRLTLLNFYLKRKYHYFLNKDFSSIISNVYNKAQQIPSNLISPLLTIISEFFILFFLIFFLFLLEPLGTIIIISFFSFTIFFYLSFVNKKFKKLGNDLNENDKYLFKYLEQSFSNIKETLLYKNEKYFINKFDNHQNILIRVARNFLSLQQVPRVFLEIIVLISITFLILFMNNKNLDNSLIIIKLGIFSAVAFKILPSINRIVFSYHSLKFGKSLVDSFLNEFKLNDLNNEIQSDLYTKKLEFNKSIIFSKVGFSYYKSQKTKFIKDASFKINYKDIVLILGKTGSGKSTFIDLIMGLLEPSEGKITIDGININEVKRQWQSKISYVGQQTYITDASIKENIIFHDFKNHNHNFYLNSLKDSEIYEYIKNLPDKDSTICGEKGLRFSGGQKQRIALARALYRNPSVLIMDEATNGLDNETEKKIFNNLIKREITIIIVSHNLKISEFCNKIIEIKEGKIDFITV